jgi:hypothetical protein
MARTHGRCRRGTRLRMNVPHGHWKTTTFVAGLTRRGMIAPFVIGGPINRVAFETYSKHAPRAVWYQAFFFVCHNGFDDVGVTLSSMRN